MSKTAGWFYCLYAVAMAVSFIYWQPVIGSIVVGFFVWLAWIVYREIGRKERELSQQGFHIEWVSPGVLRDGPDDIAFVYHDLRGEIWFTGKIEGRNSVVTIPDGSAWDRKVPDWAIDERQTIIERICKAHRNTIVR